MMKHIIDIEVRASSLHLLILYENLLQNVQILEFANIKVQTMLISGPTTPKNLVQGFKTSRF